MAIYKAKTIFTKTIEEYIDAQDVGNARRILEEKYRKNWGADGVYRFEFQTDPEGSLDMLIAYLRQQGNAVYGCHTRVYAYLEDAIRQTPNAFQAELAANRMGYKYSAIKDEYIIFLD